jgi:hypothetical protein
MKKIIFTLFVLTFIFSCKETVINDNNNNFKTGIFEIPAGKNFVKETIIRKDSIQISKYEDHIDTLSIKWKNNFFYTLKYINPKNDMQKDPMFVQINKVYKDSYDFTVKIGFSNFSTKGTIHKVKK